MSIKPGMIIGITSNHRHISEFCLVLLNFQKTGSKKKPANALTYKHSNYKPQTKRINEGEQTKLVQSTGPLF